MNELVKVENNEIVIVGDIIEQYKQFDKLKKAFELKDKEFKQALKDAMEQTGKTKLIINGLCATVKSGTTRTTLDSKRLKEECPDVYEEYSKTSSVASSITLTIED